MEHGDNRTKNMELWSKEHAESQANRAQKEPRKAHAVQIRAPQQEEEKVTEAPENDKGDINILALTEWKEGRGEPVRGLEGIAAVVMNRVKVAKKSGRRFWWGNTVTEVCLSPKQFSCWNPGDLNESLTPEPDDAIFDICKRIARAAVRGALLDPTKGATHYHATWTSPFWAQGKEPCVRIGGHLFYNDID